MVWMLVTAVGGRAAASAGVPDDLAECTRVLLVVEGEGVRKGDVVLLGQGDTYGLYRTASGRFELKARGEGDPVARGDIVGILKKFDG